MPPRHVLRWLQSGFLPDEASSVASSESSLVLTPCRWQSTFLESSSSSSSSPSTSTNRSGRHTVDVSAVHGGGWGFGIASDRRGDLYAWGDCQDYLLPPPDSRASSPSPSPGSGGGAGDVNREEKRSGSRWGEDERALKDDDRVAAGAPNGGGRVVGARARGRRTEITSRRSEPLRLLMRARDDGGGDDRDGGDDETGAVVVVAAAAGWAHVAVVVAAADDTSGTGAVRCAGWNGHGQAPLERSALAHLVRVRSLAAGERHTLAVCGDGRVWAWGDNGCGQLGVGGGRGGGGGDGDVVPAVSAPAAVTLPSAAAVAVAVAAGGRHSVVIDSDGTVYTFGWGLYGQCGHGDAEDVDAPKPCRHLLGIPCRAAAAGSAHTAVVTRDLGGLYAFGSNQFGQLGCVRGGDGRGAEGEADGDDVAGCEGGSTSATPLLIDLDFDGGDDEDDEKDEDDVDEKQKRKRKRKQMKLTAGRGAATSGRVLEVSCGSRHTAAVVARGSDAPGGGGRCEDGGGAGGGTERTRLFAWGWNAHGQLGLGDRRDRWAPMRVPIPPAEEGADDGAARAGDATAAEATTVAHVSCGWWHTVVGVAATRDRKRK